MNEEEKEKERIFLELQAEIQAGLKAYERGECIPLEDVIARLSSDRQLEWSSEARTSPQRHFRGWGGMIIFPTKNKGLRERFRDYLYMLVVLLLESQVVKFHRKLFSSITYAFFQKKIYSFLQLFSFFDLFRDKKTFKLTFCEHILLYQPSSLRQEE